MNRTEKYTENYLKAFKNHFNGEAGHLFHQVRQNAVKAFVEMGFPSTKVEEWRFTNVAEIAKVNFSPANRQSVNDLKKEDIKPFLIPDFDGPVLIIANGFFVPALSNLENMDKDVSVMSLAESFENNAEIVRKIGKIASFKDDMFIALNTAFSTDGIYLRTGENKVINKPIHLLHITMGNTILGTHRNFISIGKNSEVTIIETHNTINSGPVFSNVVSELIIDENAHLKHYRLQNAEKNGYHIENTCVTQEASSSYLSVALDFGGKLVRNNLNVALNGENSRSVLNGLYVARDNQHIDNHTFLDHAQPHCESHELYRGILNDKSKGVFSGKILVRQDAQKTDAKQSNNCLLLSDDAKIDTKPQLEIYADDVKCTHGATVGQLDETSIFYLRARGIPYHKAKSILTYAFAEEVIDSIENEALNASVEELLLSRLDKS